MMFPMNQFLLTGLRAAPTVIIRTEEREEKICTGRSHHLKCPLQQPILLTLHKCGMMKLLTSIKINCRNSQEQEYQTKLLDITLKWFGPTLSVSLAVPLFAKIVARITALGHLYIQLLAIMKHQGTT
jgi:hypothetical protein